MMPMGGLSSGSLSHEAGEFKGTLQLYTNDPDNRLVNIAVDATRFIPNALSDTETTVSDKAAEVVLRLLVGILW